MDAGVVQRSRPAPAARHYPLPQDCVTMSRRSAVSRVRENRTQGLKGGWGNGPASRAPPLTTNGSHLAVGVGSAWTLVLVGDVRGLVSCDAADLRRDVVCRCRLRGIESLRRGGRLHRG